MSATSDAASPHLMWSRDRSRSTVSSLCGDYDLATRGQLQLALAQAVPCDHEDVLVLDLSRLEFCDVSRARLICNLSRSAHVVVTGMSAIFGRMFDLLAPDITLSPSAGAVCDSHHLVPTQRRGLSTSTRSTSPSRDTDGARPESPDEVQPPTPDVADLIGLDAPQQGELHRPHAATP